MRFALNNIGQVFFSNSSKSCWEILKSFYDSVLGAVKSCLLPLIELVEKLVVFSVSFPKVTYYYTVLSTDNFLSDGCALMLGLLKLYL
jgi:hypothetical protein